jgi:hypothetical protein
MKKIIFIALFLQCFFVQSQDQEAINYAQTISVSDLSKYLNIIASDALGGRETGESGQKMAAAYIRHFFKTNDLRPIVYTPNGLSYYQEFDLVSMKPGEAWIKLGNLIYKNFEDIFYRGNRSINEPIKTKPVFAGFGRKEDYDQIDVRGKNVIIYCIGDRIDRTKKVSLAVEEGAAQVFIIMEAEEQAFERTAKMYKRYLSDGRLSFPPEEIETDQGYFMLPLRVGIEILNTSTKELQDALSASKKGHYNRLEKIEPTEIEFFVQQEMEVVSTENVLGFIEGTDLKDEYIIITAHYDHVGINNGDVYNGADDDGSGTVAVMEIAQAFAEAKKNGQGPKRSILFMTVTGEEKGLLGSSYYVNYPVLPLEKTITNLNIDMIGRIDEAHIENRDYVYLIGSDKLSLQLHDLSEQVNATYTNLELDYKYNADDDPNRFYYRSDHYNFAKNNIPVIFYFNGTHADYHKATDTIDKIEFELLQKRAQLVFYTAWEIANRDERITVDVLPQDTNIEKDR